jgi:hypothetical protein
MPEARSILFIPDADTDDAASIELAKVDIAVAGNRGVIKDRHGDADQVLLALRAGLAARDLSSEPEAPTLLGVPLTEIAALTIDGAHWFEVFGPTLQLSAPSGGPVLRFRIAQTPGGKKGRFGVSQGDTIAVREIAVRGVQRKGGEPLTPDPRDPGQR